MGLYFCVRGSSLRGSIPSCTQSGTAERFTIIPLPHPYHTQTHTHTDTHTDTDTDTDTHTNCVKWIFVRGHLEVEGFFLLPFFPPTNCCLYFKIKPTLCMSDVRSVPSFESLSFHTWSCCLVIPSLNSDDDIYYSRKLKKNDKHLFSSPPEWNGKPLSDFGPDKINCIDYTWYYVGGAIGLTLIVAFIICYIVYRHRWFIRLRFYRLGKAMRWVRQRHYCCAFLVFVACRKCQQGWLFRVTNPHWLKWLLHSFFIRRYSTVKMGDADYDYSWKFTWILVEFWF